MSEFDWKLIPRLEKDKAEEYLKSRGIESKNILSVANDKKSEYPAEIIATAKVWELAVYALKYDRSGQTTWVHEAMYLLGRYEAVMNLYRASPGFSGESLAEPDTISEEHYLLFAEIVEKYLDAKVDHRYKTVLNRQKQLDEDRPLVEKRNDIICEIFDEVEAEPGHCRYYAGKVASCYNESDYKAFPPWDKDKKHGDGSRCGHQISVKTVKNILTKRGRIRQKKP